MHPQIRCVLTSIDHHSQTSEGLRQNVGVLFVVIHHSAHRLNSIKIGVREIGKEIAAGGGAKVIVRFRSLTFIYLETFIGKASKATGLNDVGGAIEARTDDSIVILNDRKSIRIR